MKTYSQFLNENVVTGEELQSQVDAAIAYLNREIPQLLPSYYNINIYESEVFGRNINVMVYDARKPSISVTHLNSENRFAFYCDVGGIKRPGQKYTFEKNYVKSIDSTIKYRKLSDFSLMGVSEKLVKWFKKNQQKIADAPETVRY